MKLIFEYEEEITEHVPDVDDNNKERERGGKEAAAAAAAEADDITIEIPKNLMRKELPLPNVSEISVVRHYTNISRMNFGVDLGFYPLGSCTMKYNPKINEDMASLDGFKNLHPLSHESCIQGSLQLMLELEHDLKKITGMDAFSLQPAAGAQGELLGVMIAKTYFKQ